MYVPATQLGPQFLSMVHVWFQPSWIVRTSRPVEGLMARCSAHWRARRRACPSRGFYRMNDLLAKTLAAQRVEVALLSAMAGLALLLSAVGIFALVANMVAQRTREIGIRMALGSSLGQAMRHIAGPGLRASALGLAVGVALCAGVLRIMRTVLYGVAYMTGQASRRWPPCCVGHGGGDGPSHTENRHHRPGENVARRVTTGAAILRQVACRLLEATLRCVDLRLHPARKTSNMRQLSGSPVGVQPPCRNAPSYCHCGSGACPRQFTDAGGQSVHCDPRRVAGRDSASRRGGAQGFPFF